MRHALFLFFLIFAGCQQSEHHYSRPCQAEVLNDFPVPGNNCYKYGNIVIVESCSKRYCQTTQDKIVWFGRTICAYDNGWPHDPDQFNNENEYLKMKELVKDKIGKVRICDEKRDPHYYPYKN
jgi:hypothetical protein